MAIETGDKDESKWAIYAALRTGDVTVLPRVKELLAVGDYDWPERAISLELQHVTDDTAAPDLIAILDSAPGDLTRTSVLIALGENLTLNRSPSATRRPSRSGTQASQKQNATRENGGGAESPAFCYLPIHLGKLCPFADSR